MTSGELEHRQRTTDAGNEVTVESVDHTSPTDKRFRLHFFNFEMARDWAVRTVIRYEYNNARIRLIAYRDWPDGPDGRELLGRYASKDI